MKLVKNYMSTRVRKVKPTDSIFRVSEILSKHDISGAPVVNRGKVMGVISESDIIKFMRIDLYKNHGDMATEEFALSVVLLGLLKEKLSEKRKLESTTKIQAKDFMTKNVISISPDDSIMDAATMMDKHQIDRLLVIEKGKLVGLVSRLDLIKALLD